MISKKTARESCPNKMILQDYEHTVFPSSENGKISLTYITYSSNDDDIKIYITCSRTYNQFKYTVVSYSYNMYRHRKSNMLQTIDQILEAFNEKLSMKELLGTVHIVKEVKINTNTKFQLFTILSTFTLIIGLSFLSTFASYGEFYIPYFILMLGLLFFSNFVTNSVFRWFKRKRNKKASVR